MRVFLLAFLCEAFISFILKGSVTEETRELLILIYMLVNSFILIGWFRIKSKDKTMFIILTLGFLIRMAALFYDRNIAWLPFNTADAQKFQRFAVETANALPDVMISHYTGVYSQVLGVIYYVFGTPQYWGHYLNIVFVMLAGTKLIDIADLLKISLKNQNRLIALWLFMPIPFLMGYALLREATIYYFITLSIYFFLKWFDNLNGFNLLLSILSVLIAASYHEGVAVILLPYIYTYMFLNRKTKKIEFSVMNIITLLIMIVVAYVIIDKNGDEIYGRVTADTGGGSAYLTSVEVRKPIELILFGPIKQIYLLFSPMPWLIRGVMDIATLLFDSSLYMYMAYLALKNFKHIETNIKTILLSFIIGTFIFGLGSLNTGTAIRHKNKFQSMMIIVMVYVIDKKEKQDENNKLLNNYEIS